MVLLTFTITLNISDKTVMDVLIPINQSINIYRPSAEAMR